MATPDCNIHCEYLPVLVKLCMIKAFPNDIWFYAFDIRFQLNLFHFHKQMIFAFDLSCHAESCCPYYLLNIPQSWYYPQLPQQNLHTHTRVYQHINAD